MSALGTGTRPLIPPQPFTPGHGGAQGDLRARGCLARFSPQHFLCGETKAGPSSGVERRAWAWGPAAHTFTHSCIYAHFVEAETETWRNGRAGI